MLKTSKKIEKEYQIVFERNISRSHLKDKRIIADEINFII